MTLNISIVYGKIPKLFIKNLYRYSNGLNLNSFPTGCDANSWAILNQYCPRIDIATGGENNLEGRPLEYRDRFILIFKDLSKYEFYLPRF
jgi:hypothetical protein